MPIQYKHTRDALQMRRRARARTTPTHYLFEGVCFARPTSSRGHARGDGVPTALRGALPGAPPA
eukprot:4820928-Lingulodinium_polyedra.AAC.1